VKFTKNIEIYTLDSMGKDYYKILGVSKRGK
jgi:hypothetical protein